MTIVPFPARHLHRRIADCVADYLREDEATSAVLIVDRLEDLERDLRAVGFPEPEVQRQSEAFLRGVEEAITRAWATG